MENNDYIRQRDGDGTKAAQRQNVRRPNGGAKMSRTDVGRISHCFWDMAIFFRSQ